MVKSLAGEEMTGTDAEACAYLYTANLTHPMDHDWAQIYLYVATQTNKRFGKAEMPADIVVEELNDYQMRELKRLKNWLYQQRTQARQERDRSERRQRKEAEDASIKAERPVLFEF